ncbi:TetR family transcriptional regulator [Acidisoma cellulosilytica]|uniref:TetR family transcriptional regulator n=1 Tax=Acidisoma cellulosilyticum TaxID=2802395 RepID=A0A964E1X9_9PROT|nr:TetR/AcrR family transcriptional regulator [Acidisoma cellulosilyticum]MCB8879000.1 TetR family transcriptional regulator [Acidisoma cellulosilyticum]
MELAIRNERGTREGRRRDLVEAAIAIIARNGLAGTTLAKVAAGAGLTAGIVNHHFDTKEALLVETLRTLSEEFAQGLETALAEAGQDAEAALAGIIDHNFDPAISDAAHVAVWFAFQAEAPWRAAYTEICGDRDALYMDAIRGRFAQLGLGPADADVQARAFAGLLDRYWQDILFLDARFDRQAARDACRRFLGAVLPVKV